MVEVVTVQKYKSLDGYTYDNESDAKRADDEWRTDNEFDLERDISSLTKRGDRDMQYIRRSEEQRKYSQFPKLYVLENKYETLRYVAKSVDAVPLVYFEILKVNRDCGFYYDAAPKAISDEIIRTNNHLAAMSFVSDRSNRHYQYEEVHIETVTIYGE